MLNREIYSRDPLSIELLNNGVSKVAEIEGDSGQVNTLRFELETFVCDGEYAKGLERILQSYLGSLNREEQKAVWVSGFFGSGKSHLVKILRYLWADYTFNDGATARSLVQLPSEISDLLVELENRSKPYGGLRAAAGTLGAGSMENVRLAFVQLILRAAGLPETISQARFVLWLQSQGWYDQLQANLTAKGKTFAREVRNFKLSIPLAEALVEVDPNYGTPANAQASLRDTFPENTTPTIGNALELIHQVFDKDGMFPCTLLVVDEVQQFIAEVPQRAMDTQEIFEACCTKLDSRLLLVGTGQSALTTTSSLQRLQARFAVRVQLTDSDVESVIRKTVLLKKPEREMRIKETIEANQGEISRHLQNTRLASRQEDDPYYVPDYPLLPARRRFWERVLRNTDHTGNAAQLRTQLKIVFDATRETAERPLGTVVPVDYIYDQIADDLLNTGQLEREYHEIIRGLKDGTPKGQLRSRACAAAFLCGKLPREGAGDDGVRATADTIADLLVEDLAQDGPKLRQDVPKVLKSLVDEGKLMVVGDEYRLQTREGVQWNHDFNRRRTSVLNDEARINSRREELLRDAVAKALRPVTLQHGVSKEKRKLFYELSTNKPTESKDGVTLWIRDGWNDDPNAVLNDARAASTNSPMLFGYLPRDRHEELRQAIATELAARETIDAHGTVTSPPAIEARNAIETQLEVAKHRVQECLGHIVGSSKVYLGGGQEVNGIELADKAEDAAKDALDRLFWRFPDADHANWSQVVSRAKGGDVGALSQVGYQGETSSHPVCREVLAFVGAGKKGRDIRDNFKSSPFGWGQDVVDGALYSMMVAGNLRATLNGRPVQVGDIPQGQMGIATFHVDVPPLNVTQRLDLRALFQNIGVSTQNGQESAAASEFLNKLLALAASAGGEPPKPESPDTGMIRELQHLSGNAQLLEIHGKKDELTKAAGAWKKTANLLAKRVPAWDRLVEFDRFAADLPEAAEWKESIDAVLTNRTLAADPDPVPPIMQKVTQTLRDAVSKSQTDLAEAFTKGAAQLEQSDVWKRLTAEQQTELTDRFQLKAPPVASLGTENEILDALRARPLPDRRNLVDAVPQRFTNALSEAAKLLEPKAVRVSLPPATIRNEAELDAWLDGARQLIAEKLQDGGSVIL